MKNKKRIASLLLVLVSFTSKFTGMFLYAEKMYIKLNINGQKVNRFLEIENIKEYDEDGNLIHEKFFNGPIGYIETFYEYDNNGNKLHCIQQSFNGEQLFTDNIWYQYNNKGFLISEKYSERKIITYKYRHKGDKIYGFSSDGWESEYNLDGKLLYRKKKRTGTASFIIGKTSDDIKINQKLTGFDEDFYKYDHNGNLIYSKDFQGQETWIKYNKYGHKGYEKWGYPDNYSEKSYEYDYENNIVYVVSLFGGGSVKKEIHKLEYHKDKKKIKKDIQCLYDFKN